jgi:hypothetical protein
VPFKHVRYLVFARSRLNHVCATPPNPDYITLVPWPHIFSDSHLLTHINRRPSPLRTSWPSPILSCVQSSRTSFCFRTCFVISDWKCCAHSSSTPIHPWLRLREASFPYQTPLDFITCSPGHEYGSEFFLDEIDVILYNIRWSLISLSPRTDGTCEPLRSILISGDCDLGLRHIVW